MYAKYTPRGYNRFGLRQFIRRRFRTAMAEEIEIVENQTISSRSGADQSASRLKGSKTEANNECCHKRTPRSDGTKADIQRRLNRAIGQLNGIKDMVDDNRYCGDVLTQLAAVESAVRRVSEIILRDHMRTCVIEEIRDGNDEVVDELVDLMRKFS